ncbi:MAG: DUF932 domain-containing protein [bacterium]|nr:DUF932 domain-containing protein [bacterium]
MRRHVVDLNSHMNETVVRGNPADFPVTLRPVFHEQPEGRKPIPTRRAIVREDTGEAIAVVSNRYTLVPHTRILDLVEQAIGPLEVGPVPRGIYVDRQGARMRAIFKFPALASPVLGRDEICPCLQVRNTYDGSARIAVHIGAFRFVCTNLAVGGGGVFAGGFVSIHAGEIPIEKMADQLAQYLTRFDRIVGMYRQWSEFRPEAGTLSSIFEQSLKGRPEGLWDQVLQAAPATVFDAYNVMTDFATHRMRSYRTAFDLLERINAGFQETFPVIDAERN